MHAHDRPTLEDPTRGVDYEPADVPDTEQAPTRPSLIIALILVTSVAVVMMVASIYYRWVNTPDPTSALVVEGDSTVDGATVTVVGEDKREITATLNQDNSYATPVLLSPGSYVVTVQLNDKVLLKKDFVLEERQAWKYVIGEKARQNTPTVKPD